MVYFISGHINLSDEEFAEHYIPKIDMVMDEDKCPEFVVGDAPGADTMAQVYLCRFFDKQECAVDVYHMHDMPRNLADERYALDGGHRSDEDRDAAMTAASDFDILWVRLGRENSGTSRNGLRRFAKEVLDGKSPILVRNQ